MRRQAAFKRVSALTATMLVAMSTAHAQQGEDLREAAQNPIADLISVPFQNNTAFLAEVLGLSAPKRWGPFVVVAADNGTNIDFMDADGEITPQHYAFLVSESEFEEIFGRIRERTLPYWSDPAQTQRDEINHHDGGRGLYFEDPNGHLLGDHHAALRQRQLES